MSIQYLPKEILKAALRVMMLMVQIRHAFFVIWIMTALWEQIQKHILLILCEPKTVTGIAARVQYVIIVIQASLLHHLRVSDSADIVMELNKIMDRKMKYIFTYLSVIILTIYFTACSELQTNIEAPKPLTVHKEGILVDSSADFHGNLIRANNWDMISCQPCHGLNYEGGRVNESCLTCHNLPSGPENCTTCHGSPTSNAPPEDLSGNTSNTFRGVGAHQVHLAGNMEGRNLTCTQCHLIPGSVYGFPEHIDNVSGAEVLMDEERSNLITNESTTSQYDPSLPLFVPDPQYNASNLTCSNSYCHGYFKNGNLTNAPVWNDPATSECGSCHGSGTNPLPKIASEGGTHPDDASCSNCHGGVVDTDMNFINPSKHIDGKLNLFGNDIEF